MGMTGKFWAPYKGGSSYDSFGDDDQDVVEKISAGEDSDAFDTAAGPDAMEDMAGQRRQVPAAASSGKKASPQLSLQVPMPRSWKRTINHYLTLNLVKASKGNH